MVNLEYYRVFYYVAKHSSVSLAAEKLFISQPAVSQAIKHLENNLGGSLFFRTPKGMRLTPEGEMLYQYVSKGYEYIALGEDKYRELFALETGEIRIGASDMTLQFYLLPYLEQFHKLYPKISFKVTNAPTPNTLEHLSMGKIDFGVVSAPVPANKGLKVTPVLKINDIFVANHRYQELNGRVVKLSELSSYPIICLEKNTSTRKHVDNFLKEKNVRLGSEFELATSELIVQFAVRGLGVGCVVRNFAEEQLGDKSLFEINIDAPIPARDICIVTLDKIHISPAGKKLLNILI